MRLNLNHLEVTFHRTVRVAEGRTASSLPPSLGPMKLYKVSDYRKNCPADWDDGAYFASLHDTEAMWISFHSHSGPCAVLIGAGGVNALTGQKLGTQLEKDNYLVCPPQPWIDGWKDVDGTVHQFIATPHKKGGGLTVAEQIIGAESKTGALGLAIFEPKDGAKLHFTHTPAHGVTSQSFGAGGLVGQSLSGGQSLGPDPVSYSTTMDFMETAVVSDCASEPPVITKISASISGQPPNTPATASSKTASSKTASSKPQSGKLFLNSTKSGPKHEVPRSRSITPHVEMGLGKGGKITQKIYSDPHGLEVWQAAPTVVFAFYLVDAATAAEITGEKVAAPVDYASYKGPWFGMQDEKLPDVLGTSIFSGLKSAAFTGDTSNAPSVEKTEEPVPVEVKAGA